ncbi:hypothetical protein [Embleya sp. NBC_00896]|uniref:hypothetical protein n=1 Tax=Embleya sp. NBC_00896 TaxID=2975961 RepID=UPI002F91B2F3|nr:hypothetical protein OG928_47980 [Embleya sp. NBC_00896]
MLIDDAAHRAEQLLRGEDDTAPDALSDAVRWLAAPAGLRHLPTVAASTGKSPVELRRLIVAYRHGGCAAVHAAEHPTDPDPEVLAAAAAAVRRARGGAGGTVVVEGNRLTDPGGRIQIRVGPDDRWHPFTASGPHRDWQSAAGCSPDPAAAYGAALAALRARPQYA